MEHLSETFFKIVAVDFAEVNDFSSTSLLKTQKVVVLVEEQGYAEHRDAVVNGLLNSIGSTVSYEDFGLRVAQEILLRHPVHYHGVVAQSRWTWPLVSPYHLSKCKIKRLDHVIFAADLYLSDSANIIVHKAVFTTFNSLI